MEWCLDYTGVFSYYLKFDCYHGHQVSHTVVNEFKVYNPWLLTYYYFQLSWRNIIKAIEEAQIAFG